MRFLSNKEKKELNDLLIDEYKLDKKDEITQNGDIIYKNSEKFLIILETEKKLIKSVIPHLKNIKDFSYKAVFIDSGAIPFLIKGADMMRPGIKRFDEDITKNEIVLIKDLDHSKILGVGKALYSSQEMQTQEKGISVKVLHYVRDKYF